VAFERAIGGFGGDEGIASIAVGTAIWVTGAGVAWQVQPALARPTGTFDVGQRPTGITLGTGSVWTANSADATVTRIDTRTGSTAVIEVGGTPNELVFHDGLVWVTVG
jgi:streptogramin lyase